MIKPRSFLRRHVVFFGTGFYNRWKARLTGKSTSFGDLLALKFKECEPWSDHFYKSSIDGIKNAIKAKEFANAHGFLALNAKPEANQFCGALMKEFINFMAFGGEVSIELIPFIE